MSNALDVNVLVDASRPESAAHDASKSLIERLVRGPELLCVTWATLAGYLRIVTDPRVLPEPLSTVEAVANTTSLLGRPRTRILIEEQGFWQVYRELLLEHRTRGKLVPDVHLAALLRQHGVKTLYTRDRDFRRFDFLKVVDPLDA